MDIITAELYNKFWTKVSLIYIWMKVNIIRWKHKIMKSSLNYRKLVLKPCCLNDDQMKPLHIKNIRLFWKTIRWID
jgi:hypothetical protein